MTNLEVYRGILIELDKAKAPTRPLQSYVYYINRGLQQVVNKRYSKYMETQQVTDDISNLSVPFSLVPSAGNVELPADYFHLLRVEAKFKARRDLGCDAAVGQVISKPVTRMTEDNEGYIMQNSYMTPKMTDKIYYKQRARLLELKAGDYKRDYELVSIDGDYLKKPPLFVLAKADVDSNTATELDFPDYIWYEVIRESVTLLQEAAGSPRTGSYPQVSQSII